MARRRALWAAMPSLVLAAQDSRDRRARRHRGERGRSAPPRRPPGTARHPDWRAARRRSSRIEAALRVDTAQRFATGFSYGGGMSYALACGRATVFRAVAVFSGAQLSGCDGGTQPVAYLGIHGIGDSVLNIAQGRSLRDRFVRSDGCPPQNPREPAAGSQTHITTEYTGCRAGYPVVWAAFDGGHLPGAVDGCACESGVRTWTRGEVWKFFSQFQGTPPGSTAPSTPLPEDRGAG